MSAFLFPCLYQINTRVWMTELSYEHGRPATLDDIPDSELDRLAHSGFDWVWFLSVWQTGKEGQHISRLNPEWREDFQATLPDLAEEDIAGSGFAIISYSASDKLGGDAALARLRKRLGDRGMKLMLDFIPNHTGLDHDWVAEHDDYFIHGTACNLETKPKNYTQIHRDNGDIILAHGRDPFFPGWPDTLQLNYGNAALQEAMIGELKRIAGQCDGVRCDMAMLVLPDVFERTWGISCQPFWPEAIRLVREIHPEFCFMAEVYWDLEWTLLLQGFTYAYDKRLYDRLKEGHVKAVREHFFAGLDFQAGMARFLENHDEQRAATEFPSLMQEAAAIITYLSPGLRFFHQGQFQGRKKRISPHLVRAPKEPVNETLEDFYKKLLVVLRKPVFRTGNWRLLECVQAWDSNPSNESFISFAWHGEGNEMILITVNYSSFRNQCYVKLPFQDLGSGTWIMHDLFSGITYEREGNDLQSNGMYLDEEGWKYYVFTMRLK